MCGEFTTTDTARTNADTQSTHILHCIIYKKNNQRETGSEEETMATTGSAVRHLYRTMIRAARKFEDYNYRSYALRKVKTEFKQNRGESGDELKHVLKEVRSCVCSSIPSFF